jgi:hypothetical protein
MDVGMALLNVFLFVLLVFFVVGTILSVWYGLQILLRLWSDNKDESMPILEEVRQAAKLTETPVFGDTAWFLMVATALSLLTCRAGWQNSSKVAMQLVWKYEESDTEESA